VNRPTSLDWSKSWLTWCSRTIQRNPEPVTAEAVLAHAVAILGPRDGKRRFEHLSTLYDGDQRRIMMKLNEAALQPDPDWWLGNVFLFRVDDGGKLARAGFEYTG
jgi:hypothetical protein